MSTHQAASAAQYSLDAARLYGLSLFNRADSNRRAAAPDRSSNQPPPIRYYIDVAVVLPFLIWPGRFSLAGEEFSERKNLRFLTGIGGSDDDELVAEAALTGEFMCDFRESGPAGAQNLLHEHWHEFMDNVQAHGHRFHERMAFYREQSDAHPRSIADDFDSLFEDFSKDQKRLNNRLRDGDYVGVGADYAKWSARFERHPIMEAAMVKRALRRHLIGPAMAQPLGEEIKSNRLPMWRDELLKTGKRQDRAESDAMCLCRIEALNKADKGKTIHCLVTGDGAIHEAYWRVTTRDFGGRPDYTKGSASLYLSHYALRHPAQFAPSLNQRDIQNNSKDEYLFNGVARAAETILTEEAQTEGGAIEAGFRALFDPKWRARNASINEPSGALRAVQEKWLTLSRLTVSINYFMLTRRIAAAKQQVDTIRKVEGPAIQGILREQRTTLEKIYGYHVDQSAKFALRQALSVLQAQEHTESSRAAFHLFATYEWLPRQTEFRDVVTSLRDPRSRDRTMARLEGTVESRSGQVAWRNFLFAGLVAEIVNDWHRAVWYFKLARDAARIAKAGPLVLCDVFYLLGRARRLKVGDNFETALEAQKSSIERARSAGDTDLTLSARASSELGSLYLARLMQLMAEQLHEKSLEKNEYKARIADSAALAEGWLRRARDQAPTNDRALFIRRQACLNLAIFALLTFAMPDDFSSEILHSGASLKLEIDRAKTEWRFEEKPHVLATLYLEALSLTDQCLDEPNMVSTLDNALFNDLLEGVRAESKDDVPYSDVIEAAMSALPTALAHRQESKTLALRRLTLTASKSR